jgi:nucleotide-binding universal stress UspA family protein
MIVAVGTDGSETAEEAVKQAAEIAKRFDAKLVLLSVGATFKGEEDDLERQWAWNPSALLATALQRTESRLRRDGIDCETHIGDGDPAEMLVQLATRCDADLLVIGNKGMNRRVLGGVPNSVTHKAECSVLVVKTT